MKSQRNLLKRGLVLFLALIMSITTFSFVGCGEDDVIAGNKPKDETKTQLNIGVYNGGLGYTWLREVATKFEEYYADTVFEDGKIGVQVTLDPQKDGYNAEVLVPNLQAGTGYGNDMYYTAANYMDFVGKDILLDVTDTLNEKVYDENGELARTKDEAVMSAMDKMDPFFVENYKHSDGQYYGWPFEDSVVGLIYDADLFRENGWAVPETMEQFADLLETMLSYNVTPYTVNGNAPFYYTALTTAAVVQYEGVENADMNLTYSGKYSGNSNIDSSGNMMVDGKSVTVGNADFKGSYPEVEITPANAYLLADQQGKYEAIKFLKLLAKKKEYYTANSFLSSQSHLIAQSEYIYSVQYAEMGKTNRIAMLIDGDWWENEARNEFNTMGSGADADRYGFGVRDFRLMPFPKMEGQKTDKRVVVAKSAGKIAFINKATTVPEVAKLFLQFQLSKSSLSTFTGETGCCLPYDYDVNEADWQKMSPFAKSNWEVRHDPNVIVYRAPFKRHLFYTTTNTSSSLSGVDSEIRFNLTGVDTSYILKAFYMYRDKNITPEQVFASSLSLYNKKAWDTSYAKFVNLYGAQ